MSITVVMRVWRTISHPEWPIANVYLQNYHFHSILKTDKKTTFCRLKEWKKLSKRCAGRGGLIWEMPKRTIVLFVKVLPQSVRLIYSLNPKNQMSHVFGNFTKWQMAWALRFLCKECHIFLSWSKIVNLLSKLFNCGVPRCVLEDSSHKGHTPLWSLNRLWNLDWWLDAMVIYGVVFNLCCRIYWQRHTGYYFITHGVPIPHVKGSDTYAQRQRRQSPT